MKTILSFSFGVLLSLTFMAHAAPSEKAKAEINGLMNSLAQSGCQFQRNGAWHEAKEARAHLQRKYDYLLKKNLVDTSEQFIHRAASTSSVSGKPYRVKCGALELDSAVWFDMQLQRLRKTGAAGA
jgi:hypothetical protein